LTAHASPRDLAARRIRTHRRRPAAEQNPSTDAAAVASRLTSLVQVEAEMREAESIGDLHYMLANGLRTLSKARQVIVHRAYGKAWRLAKISSVTELDRNAPLVRLLDGHIKREADRAQTPVIFELECGKSAGLPFRKACLVPLLDRKGRSLGTITFLRETPFEDRELALFQRLGATASHAWAALIPKRRPLERLFNKKAAITLAVLLFLIGCIPVRLSALAPVEVIARDPFVLAAPMAGAIETVHVEPNQEVVAGDLLFSFRALELENALAIAERDLQVAAARLRRANQSAFTSLEGRRELTVAKGEYEVALAERDFAASRLAEVKVRAPAKGVVLFSSPQDWVGRPVTVGERIMLLADPTRTRLRIDLPVADGIVMDDETDTRFFLDADPLNAIEGSVLYKPYRAEPDPANTLAYPVIASAKPDQDDILRIGMRGTAQLKGRTVPLAFNLLRKPISTIRQWLGV